MRIGIIGCGKVGASIAYRMMHADFVKELFLVDKKEDLAQGEAYDLNAASVPEEGICAKVCKIEELSNIDTVILCCGAKRDASKTRESLFEENKKIIKEVALCLKERLKNPFTIVITNPVEPLVRLLIEELQFDKRKTFGLGTYIDTVRLKYLLSESLGISFRKIDVLAMGEHGERMFFPKTPSTIEGKRVFEVLSFDEWERVCKKTKGMGATLIELKGGASWAVASCVYRVLSSIFYDKKEIFPLSVYLDSSHYGVKQDVKSVPVKVGKEGITEILLIPLNEEERAWIKGV